MTVFVLEVEGSGKDVGSHLKCLYFYSPNLFWLSAIKGLLLWGTFLVGVALGFFKA